MSELHEHTPGPWRWEYNPDQKTLKLCGGAARYDLKLLDFVRSGMRGAIARFRDPGFPLLNVMELPSKWAIAEPGREHHADWFRLIDHPDAHLIAAAPDLLAAVVELLEVRTGDGLLDPACPAFLRAQQAVAKAKGGAA